MKKLKGILILVLLLALLAGPIAVLASDISDAHYYGTIIISNNSTATNYVSVNCSINTQALIDGGYLNSSANNCVIRSSAGADLPFMPSVNASYPWCIWVPYIGLNSHLSNILYTANSTGGEIRYFPDTGGMTTLDSLSMELGDNWSIEQKGWVNTANASVLAVADFRTFTEVDVPGKITVTANRVTGVDVDRDESIYLYKDEGVDYFDALDIDFEIYLDSNSLVDGLGSIAFTSVAIGDMSTFGTTEIGVYIAAGAPNIIALYRGRITDADSYVCAVDTAYYCTLTRAAGADTAICEIWNIAARTGAPLDTLSVAGYGTIKWRYVYGFTSYNAPLVGRDWDGYVQDFTYYQRPTLIDKGGAFKTYIAATGNITSQIHGAPSITTSGISSGEYTVNITKSAPFWGIGVDTEVLLPIRGDLILNIPLWQTELSGSPFTSIDPFAEICTVNGATWTPDGYTFDGVNDNIILPANWMPTTGTIEMWVKYDFTIGQYLLSTDLNEISIYNSAGGAGLAFYYNAGVILSFVPDWVNDTFIHMVICYTHGGNVNLYINGVSKDSGAIVGGLPSTVASRLGEATNGAGDLTGTIGEFRVYNVHLIIPDEVRENYDATKCKYDGTTNRDLRSTLTTVPNTANDWFYYQNLDDYWEYTAVTVNSTQVQYIDWEYDDTTFQDSSAFDNDATPTFRTISSDPDVSAVLSSFLPVAEAKAPAYALEDAPPFIETVPTIVSEWDVVPPAGAFPLAAVITAVATATKTPPQLPLLIIAAFIILALSLAMSAVIRKYGSGTIFVKILMISAVMGVFIALGNFGIDFWMLFVFLVIAIALAMASRHAVWQ